MHQQTLPLWVSDRQVTFTTLRKRCEDRYESDGPELVIQAMRNLAKFEEAITHDEALRALHGLSDDVMELSILDNTWEDLSTLIFEHSMLAPNATNPRAKRAIRSLFDATITLLKGKANAHPDN